MRIAYLINQYPKITHTFIRREIQALEQHNVNVTRIALRGWDDQLTNEEDLLERNRTRYVLREGLPPLLFALVRMLFRKPIRFAAALALAWRMSRRADRPLAVHLAYLAEACRIVPWLWSDRVQHLHAHFGSNPAEIAMIVHVLGGPQLELYRPRNRNLRSSQANWTA